MSETVLDWTIHPFAERRRRGIAVLAAILAFSVGASFYSGHVYWGLFSFAVLFLSLESFYFPTRFVLEDAKLTVIRRFSKSEREWGAFRRCLLDGNGLTLSPFSKSSWLEEYRAIRLRFGPRERDEVVRFVREHVQPTAEWVQDPRW
ncbi:MAG: hypothetical protein QUU85_12315, partial [Candidatus Eisenbacteria bacterium]|nr:hypothetical protein [Candidatus Eisenbacteria bacterium]